MISAEDPHIVELLRWGTKQSHILTGGGVLESYSTLGIDFKEEDLPHYLMKRKIIRQTFLDWLKLNKRSDVIIGAWSRPLFSGGWMESTQADTDAFNLQTPSIFIDMRIPKNRPSTVLKKFQSLKQCTDTHLRILSRQHCFSGYSLPSNADSDPLVFTRHHIIDWNYHPSYPRSRPNRWWIQTNSTAIRSDNIGLSNDVSSVDSFKEFSTVRDKNQVPVYMVRLLLNDDISIQTSDIYYISFYFKSD